MPHDEQLGEGDHVTISGRRDAVIWDIETIESRIHPLGVILRSGMTGRTRRETLSNVRLHSKGKTA